MGRTGRASAALASEAQLAAAWEERRYPPAGLVDVQGDVLRVVFPGRRWGGPGPDFRGAVIARADGTLLRGDVEVHRRASGWARHGHARDPAYANVVLHVVQVVDAPTLDASGRAIPTVALHLTGAAQLPALAPCWPTTADIVALVEAAGRERFRAKAARFEGDLAVADPDQVLWRGLAEALGYSCNTAAFGRLADAVPWLEAERMAAEWGAVGVSALLLGTAGLVDDASAEERQAWTELGRLLGARPALSPHTWVRAALRPGNDPAQRCRGLAQLAARWGSQGPNGSPAGLALGAVRAAAAARRPRLWQFALVDPWIGRGRAEVIAVNVLLPFAYAAGGVEAATLFERMPAEPPNRVTGYMAAQLAAPGIRFRTACQQQGLLHLFKTACADRFCERCPAARPLVPAAFAWR